MRLNEITELFGIGGVASVSEISTGHINSTYHVESESGVYILQSLNGEVFKNPQAVMKNIAKIQKHFENTESARVRVPHYLSTAEGENYAECDGKLYRMYKCAEEENVLRTRASGFALGEFQRVLSLKNIKLEPTIEKFHDYGSYFSQLVAAEKASALKKIDSSIMHRLDSLGDTLNQVFTVDFPKRIIHGDAKIGNFILGSVSTVLDLDTVMKSYAAIDYGDLIRSVMGGSASAVFYESAGRAVSVPDNAGIHIIRTVTEGYAEGLSGTLNDDEIYSLYYGILYVTGELSVRYLTDYLSGGKYFGKPASACLSRANDLLKQLSIFISSGDEITDIIYKAFKKK